MKKSLLPYLSISFLCIVVCTSGSVLRAQNMKTSNQFIVGDVEGQSGFVTVLLPPGRIAMDKQLSFANKSFFTCQIGSTIFTNNEVLSPFPSNAKRLSDGTTEKTGD